MIPRTFRPPVCFVLALASASTVGAAEEPDATPAPDAAPGPEAELARGFLDEVVVTANRSPDRVFDVPYGAEAVEGDWISDRGVRTLPEALQEVPGVMVQKTSWGQGSPYLRGFTGFRTLLLIDGIRLNNAVFREGPNQYWSTVDPLTVERLEVVKGPSSVLYGSDAIGGTVNAITRSRDPGAPGGTALGGAGGDLTIGGRTYFRYASAESSFTPRGEVATAYGGRLGILGGVTYRDFGDLNAGKQLGVLPYTEYEELSGDLKAVYRLQPNMDLVVAYQGIGQDDVPRTHSTVYSRSWEGTTVGTDLRRELDQGRQLVYTQLHWNDVAEWLARLSFSLSYHLQTEEEDRIRSDGRRTVQGVEDHALGCWVQLESPSPVGTLTYGVEYYRDFVGSYATNYAADGTFTSESPRGPVADDAAYGQLGAYVQDRFEPVERLELTVGGRINYIHTASDEVDPNPAAPPVYGDLDEDWAAAVGSGRILYRALDEWNLFAGASQGFRAPNLSDLTRFDVARSGEVEVPSPGLEPERYLTLEGGTKTRLEEARLEASVSYFYTFIDGMIQRLPTGNTIDGLPVVVKDNVGDGFVHGVELGASWNFWGGFTAFGNFTWIAGESDTYVGDQEERRPLSRIQPATALLGLRWEAPKKRYWIEATALIADDQSRLAPEDVSDTQRIPPGGTPGYTACALRGGAEVLDGLRLFAGVENITDHDYRVHGSGQNQPGTNVILGLDWRL